MYCKCFLGRLFATLSPLVPRSLKGQLTDSSSIQTFLELHKTLSSLSKQGFSFKCKKTAREKKTVDDDGVVMFALMALYCIDYKHGDCKTAVCTVNNLVPLTSFEIHSYGHIVVCHKKNLLWFVAKREQQTQSNRWNSIKSVTRKCKIHGLFCDVKVHFSPLFLSQGETWSLPTMAGKGKKEVERFDNTLQQDSC